MASVVPVTISNCDCMTVCMFMSLSDKEALYRIWCGVNRIGDSGVNRLSDTSSFVNTAGQLLLTLAG